MPNFSSVDDFISGDEAHATANGKYVLLEVPDYNKGTTPNDVDANGIPKSTSKLDSFLRLGAAAPSWRREKGADLVQLAYLVGPAGKASDPTIVKRFTKVGSPEFDATIAKLVVIDEQFTKPLLNDDPTTPNPSFDAELAVIDAAAKAARQVDIDAAARQNRPAPTFPAIVLFPPFIDDQRARGTSNLTPDGSLGHGMTADQRREESARLHTRGGWRDHSDGNRITTTRGDKIEVIQGNYKLIVMGRTSDITQGMGWEATGNNVQDFAGATMPGASVTVEWVNHRYGGAWLLQNSTERVYQYSRNAGNFRTENWGDLQESYTGSENPPIGGVGLTPTDGTLGHPTLRDEPLDDAEALEKTTGAKVAAPTTSSVGLPRGNPRIVEKTWASRIDSSKGSAAWRIPQIHEETWVTRMTSKTEAHEIEETTRSDTIVSTTYAGAIVETTIAGMNIGTNIGPVVELFAGAKLSIDLSGTIGISGPVKLELSLGYSGSYDNFKDEMAALENKVTGVQNNLTNTRAELNNTKISLSAVDSSLHTTKTELATAKTAIATNTTQINTAYQVLAGQVMLG